MKTVGRILIILAAACLVVGATWTIGQSSGDSAFPSRERPDVASSEGRPAPPAGEFGERGDHHAAQPFSIRGWLGFTQTLVPMTIIFMLVALPSSLWKKRQRSRREDTSPLPAG